MTCVLNTKKYIYRRSTCGNTFPETVLVSVVCMPWLWRNTSPQNGTCFSWCVSPGCGDILPLKRYFFQLTSMPRLWRHTSPQNDTCFSWRVSPGCGDILPLKRYLFQLVCIPWLWRHTSPETILVSDGIYARRVGKEVPIKWTAPESLQDDIYTIKSDVLVITYTHNIWNKAARRICVLEAWQMLSPHLPGSRRQMR